MVTALGEHSTGVGANKYKYTFCLDNSAMILHHQNGSSRCLAPHQSTNNSAHIDDNASYNRLNKYVLSSSFAEQASKLLKQNKQIFKSKQIENKKLNLILFTKANIKIIYIKGKNLIK